MFGVRKANARALRNSVILKKKTFVVHCVHTILKINRTPDSINPFSLVHCITVHGKKVIIIQNLRIELRITKFNFKRLIFNHRLLKFGFL